MNTSRQTTKFADKEQQEVSSGWLTFGIDTRDIWDARDRVLSSPLLGVVVRGLHYTTLLEGYGRALATKGINTRALRSVCPRRYDLRERLQMVATR